MAPTPETVAAENDARLRHASEVAAENESKRVATAKEDEKKRAGVRTALNEQAARVMEESQPTPTQAENDLAKLGALHPDDKVDPKNPEMPTLYEQQRAIDAGSAAPYRTRDAAARQATTKKTGE